MELISNHLLSILIAIPLLGALALSSRRVGDAAARWMTLSVSAAEFALSIRLFTEFRADASTQFVERAEWIPAWGVSWALGVDGLSLFLILLTTFLVPIAILSSWTGVTEKVRGFLAAVLVMETAMVGVFAAADLFLFYLFWEVMLIPMALMIGVWGSGRRVYAALKFVLFTMAGSLVMLVAIFYLAGESSRQLGYPSLLFEDLRRMLLPADVQAALFLAFALAFAVKVPLFPLHTWLPDAHTEAPTAGSILLAGVLLKMGGYGFVRFCLPLFPEGVAAFSPWVIGLSVTGVVYGSLVAMVQPDLKRLVAYSSVAHLGFVVLGIFAASARSVTGSVLQMVNHGLSTGALFLLVGMIYDRRHTRMISDFGGLARSLPALAVIFILTALASAGLPGLNGFVGEFLILSGSFPNHPTATVLASLGVILAAVYLLWMVERVFLGPIRQEANRRLPRLNAGEWAAAGLLVAAMVGIGVFPSPLLKRIEPAAARVVQEMKAADASLPDAAPEFAERHQEAQEQ